MSSLSYSDFVEIRSAIHTTNVGAAIMMPVGGICMYTSTTPPTGYLLCNGAEVSAADYPSLFAITGHTFDTGAGKTTTFNVPDMRGRFIVGTGQNGTDAVYNINDKGGEQTHILATNEVGAHTHGLTLSDNGHTHGATSTAASHTHGLTDNGHSHTITENDHTHGITDPGHTHGGTPNTRGGLYIDGAPEAGRGSQSDSATTGIGIVGAKTNITINSAGANIGLAEAVVGITTTLDAVGTGITASVGTTDAAVGHENRPPYIALTYIIRAI